MAVGALSTLAVHPAYAGGGEEGGQAGARRSERAAWLSALSLVGLGRPVSGHADWEREATSVALSWLRLVDESRHPASWSAAAPLFREEVGRQDWDTALHATRAPLGRCSWRKLQSRAAVSGPSGDLEGPYVVIRFESAFERRGPVAETITSVRCPDGRWRVAAYFISG
jgi:hypothetical protein